MRTRAPWRDVDALASTSVAEPGRATAVGKRTAVAPTPHDPAAAIARGARAALRRLRALSTAGGQAADAALDLRSAARRLDEAIGQLGRLAARNPDAAAARAELVAERDAVAPDVEAALGAARWRTEAAPIASQLGLGATDIRNDESARAITEGKNARGVALGSTVYLHPDRVEPSTDRGREVLAHELVHLAQARNAGSETDGADRDAAELEAADLASTIAAGGTPGAPQQYIDLSRAAADEDAPDVREITNRALARGYELPKKNPDDYYYRYKAGTKKREFELVVKGGTSSPAKRAVLKNGKFVGLEDGGARDNNNIIVKGWGAEKILGVLWNDDSFYSFAKMMMTPRFGFGVTEVDISNTIADQVAKIQGAEIKEDTFRGKVKDVFREKVVEKKLREVGWATMREMLDELTSDGDRGNLAEAWYQAQHKKSTKKDTDRHVTVQVKGDKRIIDLFDGDEVIECKDIEGDIDKDQFKAYAAMLGKDVPFQGGTKRVQRMKYVFTKPEGARANLKWLSKQFDGDLKGKLTLIVYDGNRSHEITTAADALTRLEKMGGPP